MSQILYGIVVIGFVGDFALEILVPLPPVDVTKNLWGEGGDFPSEIILIYNI